MAESVSIVIVDDEPELRDMLEAYLTKRGFTVITLVSGHIC